MSALSMNKGAQPRPSRSRSASFVRPSRTNSQRSRPPSLHRVQSSRHFDDHHVYYHDSSDHDGDNHDSASEDDSDETIVTDASRPLEKQRSGTDAAEQRQEEVETDDEPVAEVRGGIPDRRDPELGLKKKRSRSRSKPRDPNLVEWDGPDDPANPKNWSHSRRWAATFVVSSFTFISPVSSSMVAPALNRMAADLGVSNDVVKSLILSIFILAYACGPLFLGPLSEIHGRVKVLQLSNLFYLCWNLGCGFARTPGEMLAFRFLAGLGGSAPLAIGGGVLADCWPAEERGKAISIYSLAPLLGPAYVLLGSVQILP